MKIANKNFCSICCLRKSPKIFLAQFCDKFTNEKWIVVEYRVVRYGDFSPKVAIFMRKCNFLYVFQVFYDDFCVCNIAKKIAIHLKNRHKNRPSPFQKLNRQTSLKIATFGEKSPYLTTLVASSNLWITERTVIICLPANIRGKSIRFDDSSTSTSVYPLGGLDFGGL